MYFFDSEIKQEELRRILNEWDGTPYRHRTGVKGLGADCIHFVAKVLVELGVLVWRRRIVPDYPRDWHMHNTREMLLEGITRELRVKTFVVKPKRRISFMTGDILQYHFGKTAAHVGFYLDGRVYQALDGAGVGHLSVDDPTMKKRVRFLHRLLK